MAKKEKEFIDHSRIIESTVETVMHNSMMPFSEHVILDRALPRIEDGLIPVQRRILYTMKEIGVTPDKPYRKCATVVGDVLGKYHPHGDSSVYGALVRLAQTFNTRMPLVDGHGNFGSIDGDSAAAYRYTESKMTPLALQLLRDLDKDTVPMTLNFDDTREEPNILPGRYPNLFVNGAMGIAVGMATNIPPHNLGEMIDGVVAYIDNEHITLDEVMEIIPAPDFPTGALIIKNDEIRKMYETGKGRVTMRAKTSIESDGGKESIIITEIPYQVNKSVLLQQIYNLTETKKEIYGGIDDVVDESDRAGLRGVVKLKKGVSAEKILAGLFKSTNLECGFSANMLAIVDGKPRTLTLLDYLSRYVEFQREVIFKRCSFDLTAAKAREHILLGLKIAVCNIRAVVEIVLSSKTYNESKDRLKTEFDLSEKQAIAVLDIPLKKLNKLDVNKMEEELAELEKNIKELELTLSSKRRQLTVVKKELLEIKKNYADKRRSTIIDEKHIKIEAKEYVEEISIPGYILLGQNGNIRFISDKGYGMSNKGIVNCTANELVKTCIKVESKTRMIGFTKKGLAIVFDASDINDDKWKLRGTTAQKLGKVDSDDEFVEIMTADTFKIEGNDVYIATRNGMIKRTSVSEYSTEKKSTYPAIVLKDDDYVIMAQIVDPESEYVLFVTNLGMVLNAFADVPSQGRKASGVRGIKLDDKDKLIYVTQNKQEGEIVVVLKNGYAKRVIIAEIEPKNRYSKGVTLFDVKKFKDVLSVTTVLYPYDLAVCFDEETLILNTEDIGIENRTSKGKNLYKTVLKGKENIEIKLIKQHNII